MMRFSFLLMFSFLAVVEGAWGFGKGPATTEPDPVDPTPEVIRARWEATQRDGGKWSQFVFDQLPVLAPNLVNKTPSDIASFCPGFTRGDLTDKKNFWVYFLSSMTQLESSHKPELSYKEAFNDSHGNPVISRGLLQISIESGNAYGCGFRTEQDLHDPYKNLACGLRILNRWVGGDGLISGKSGTAWRGGARYWAVLRGTTHLANIRSWVKAQDVCR